MSPRIIAGAAVVAALAAAPAAAQARPGEAIVPRPVPEAAPAGAEPFVVAPSREGLGTLAVLGLAGGTLLIGAAGGFGGGRAMTRRHVLHS